MHGRLALLPVVVILAAACADGGLSGDEQRYADAWSEVLQDADGGFGVSNREADCMAEAMMAELGTTVFENASVTPAEIGDGDESNSPGELVGADVIREEQADAIVDAWSEDCLDLSEAFAASLRDPLALDDEGEACMAAGLEREGLAGDLARASFTSGSDEPSAGDLEELTALAQGCGGTIGPSADELAFTEAWSQVLQDPEDGFGVTADEGGCMASALMDELGTEVFDKAAVSPEDIGTDDTSNSPGELVGDGVISDDQADAVIDAWEAGCIDLPRVLAESARTEFGLDDAGVDCMATGLAADDLARAVVRPSFTTATDRPEQAVLTPLVALIDSCGAGITDSAIQSLALGIASASDLTQEQAVCVARVIADELGLDRLIELGLNGGDFESFDPDTQEELGNALLTAVGQCDVPLSAFGG